MSGRLQLPHGGGGGKGLPKKTELAPQGTASTHATAVTLALTQEYAAGQSAFAHVQLTAGRPVHAAGRLAQA